MPKIRQAIAVLAVAASCIGFNAYRYPVVRQMVAALSQPPQSDDPKPADTLAAETTTDPDKVRDDSVAHETAISKHPAGVVCKNGVCTMPLPESPTASLSSPSAKDATSSTPKSTAEKPPTPAASPKSDEPSADSPSESLAASKAKEAEPTSKSPESSSTKPADEPVKSESKAAATETSKSDAPDVGDAGRSAERDSKGSNPYAQMAAKFVSSSSSIVASSSNPDKPPVAQGVLVPIQRPHPRAKAAAAEGKPSSDSKPEAADKGFRHLPPVDQTPGADTIPLTPDQVQTYPVTAAQ